MLINFMYGHISRFLTHPDPKIIASLDPILGGRGWQNRLDPAMPKGPAVEKLFRETLSNAGRFRYVVSTRVDKSTQAVWWHHSSVPIFRESPLALAGTTRQAGV